MSQILFSLQKPCIIGRPSMALVPLELSNISMFLRMLQYIVAYDVIKKSHTWVVGRNQNNFVLIIDVNGLDLGVLIDRSYP